MIPDQSIQIFSKFRNSMEKQYGDETTCQVCGNPAIGMEILGCCKMVVCEDHASLYLRNLAPGKKLESGACYYVRY